MPTLETIGPPLGKTSPEGSRNADFLIVKFDPEWIVPAFATQ
jgi:hypothetical protein